MVVMEGAMKFLQINIEKRNPSVSVKEESTGMSVALFRGIQRITASKFSHTSTYSIAVHRAGTLRNFGASSHNH